MVLFMARSQRVTPLTLFLFLSNVWTIALLILTWHDKTSIVERKDATGWSKIPEDVMEYLGWGAGDVDDDELIDYVTPPLDAPKPVVKEAEEDFVDKSLTMANPLPLRPADLPDFCPECGDGDRLCAKYGEHTIQRSVSYGGPSARLIRVINQAKEGKPTKIGIIGGSVTAGHGVKTDENWAILLRDWWAETFPKSETTMINGAVPATGSSYFSTCFLEHIDDDVDLIVLEMAINDQRHDMFAEAFEWLMRALLELPKQPPVLNLQTMGLVFDRITLGGDLHTAVANYYDTPIISIRNPLLPHILQHSELEYKYFAVHGGTDLDLRHMGTLGHRMMADLLIHFIQTRLCKTYEPPRIAPSMDQFGDATEGEDEIKMDLMGVEGLEDIPRIRMFEPYERDTYQGKVEPMCMTVTASKHPLKAVKSRGWEFWTWTSPEGHKKPYFRATEPGALASFKIRIGSMGRVRVTFLKSGKYGLGKLKCWLGFLPPPEHDPNDVWGWDGWDGGRSRSTILNAYWTIDINTASTDPVARLIDAGDYLLHCEVLEQTDDPNGGHEFRLIAIDAA